MYKLPCISDLSRVVKFTARSGRPDLHCSAQDLSWFNSIKVAWITSGRFRPLVLKSKQSCTLSRFWKIQAFQISHSDLQDLRIYFFKTLENHCLFLQLWKIISFSLEINSTESWRSIWGAKALGWISLNYLSIRFISIDIIYIRFVNWYYWGWPWSEMLSRTWHGRSGIGNMESAWPVPKIILQNANWEFKYFLYNFRFVIWYY